MPQNYAGPCTDDLGVTVVVDFQGLGGSTVVRCAPGSGGAPFQGSGLEAFQAAGVQLAGTSQNGLSVVCRVNGRPAADEPLPITGDESYTEQCTKMPPAAAFWSYWQADNGGSWAFSQRGATSSTARAGGFEALSFSLNSTSTPPRTAPSRPAPAPELPPTQDPEPTPAPEPTPPPSEDPEPAPAPAPPPAPTPPPSQEPAPSPAPAPTSDQPGPSDEAPSPEPTTKPTSRAPDRESTGPETAAEESASTTASPEADVSEGDASVTTAGRPAAGDDEAATSAPADQHDPTDAASGPFTSDPTEDGGGAGALWVTAGILLLLGVLAFLASRRRRDPDITHQVEP